MERDFSIGDMMIQVLTTIAYAVVAVAAMRGALGSVRHRWVLAGLALHMMIVTVRAGCLAVWPESASWEWIHIHRLTISVAAAVSLWEWRRSLA